jgi:hypothetical protein
MHSRRPAVRAWLPAGICMFVLAACGGGGGGGSSSGGSAGGGSSAPPTVTLTPNGTSVNSGGSLVLTWSPARLPEDGPVRGQSTEESSCSSGRRTLLSGSNARGREAGLRRLLPSASCRRGLSSSSPRLQAQSGSATRLRSTGVQPRRQLAPPREGGRAPAQLPARKSRPR